MSSTSAAEEIAVLLGAFSLQQREASCARNGPDSPAGAGEELL
ncbi:MAG TPA: hypothetical protein VK988_05295 [Acidimicrobiales bacterium]|nr:hypothetical protein [Acidimicrobiales bacterium]